MSDALLLVDVINDFRHEDGGALLASFRDRHQRLVEAIAEAREREMPVIYANDNDGVWDGDSRRLVRVAIEGRGGELIEAIAPREGDRFVVKPRYSAFDSTPLDLILESLRIERIQLAGTATEMCVAQTAIDARELRYKVSVLADACACVDPRLEAVALEYLEAVTGTVVARGDVLAR
jgi:nicotinamidase-related amidase